MESEFIQYYNELFGLPRDFGVDAVWKTAPNGSIRHPAAGGRSGWYRQFLEQRISYPELLRQARWLGKMLRTEADVLIITRQYAVLVECKYHSSLSLEQNERHIGMGKLLASRLNLEFHYGLVVDSDRDPNFSKINAPYVLWEEIALQKIKMGL